MNEILQAIEAGAARSSAGTPVTVLACARARGVLSQARELWGTLDPDQRATLNAAAGRLKELVDAQARGDRPAADPGGAVGALRPANVPRGPARGGGGGAGREGHAGGDADGGGEVAVLPAARSGGAWPGGGCQPADCADGRPVEAPGGDGREGGDAGVGDAGGPQRAGAAGHRVGLGAAGAGGPGALRLARLQRGAGHPQGGSVRGGRGALRGGVGS